MKNMKTTEYYKSGKHLTNVLAARDKANAASQVNKTKRIAAYDADPVRCKHCETALPYTGRHNRFCNKSCAALFNNSLRPIGCDSRIAQAEKLRGKVFSTEEKISRKRNKPSNSFSKIQWNTCRCCGIVFYTRTWSAARASCGKVECTVHLKVGNRPYANGRRKLFYYFNKHQNKTVMLESSWENELAIWLDANNIVWHRPKYIKWVDSLVNKERLYYPDFFLPEYNVYLDPKNPTAMKFDHYKMTIVSSLIPIVYGDLEIIKEKILSMA